MPVHVSVPRSAARKQRSPSNAVLFALRTGQPVPMNTSDAKPAAGVEAHVVTVSDQPAGTTRPALSWYTTCRLPGPTGTS